MTRSFLTNFLYAILMAFSLMLPMEMHAQNVSLELKNVTVQEAVTKLQAQGHFTIVILSDDVDLQKRVSVSAKDAPLSDVLDQIFAGQKLDYSINTEKW